MAARVAALASALALQAALAAGCGGDGGDDDDGEPARAAGTGTTAAPDAGFRPAPGEGREPETVGRVELGPVGDGDARGSATIQRQGDEHVVVIELSGLPPARGRDRVAYEVWLYDSRRRAKSLGAQVAGRDGRLRGAGPVDPDDLERFRHLDVSRERIDSDRRHSGDSVARGELPR